MSLRRFRRPCPVVVELQFVAYLQWNPLAAWHYLRQFVLRADDIDDHSVALPRSESFPASILRGPPINVSSSKPMTTALKCAFFQARSHRSLVHPDGPFNALHAADAQHPMSRRGLISSVYCTFGSTTQISGSPTSVRKLNVRVMTPRKIADCCVIKSEANVSPMIIPMYSARSPISIFRAMKFIWPILSAPESVRLSLAID